MSCRRWPSGLTLGNPLDPNTRMGPLVSKEQHDRVKGYLKTGKAEGATAKTGGEPGKQEAGYFIQPTVFTGVNNQMKIAREEIFGPVASAIPFKDENDVVIQGNDTTYGLAAAVWTKDINRALASSAQAEGRHGLDQHLRSDRSDVSVRRLQAVRLRPRTGKVRDRSVHADQVGIREDRLVRETVRMITKGRPKGAPFLFIKRETRRGFHTSLGRGDPCTQMFVWLGGGPPCPPPSRGPPLPALLLTSPVTLRERRPAA